MITTSHRASGRSVVVMLVALGVTGPAGARPAFAQSLAEAARKAEEQRKANQAEGITAMKLDFDTGGPIIEPTLTVDLLAQYSNARLALGRTWWKSDSSKRLCAEARQAKYYRQLVALVEGERELTDILAFYGLSPEQYVLTHITLLRAQRRADDRTLGETSPPGEVSNTRFVIEHAAELQRLRDQWARGQVFQGICLGSVRYN